MDFEQDFENFEHIEIKEIEIFYKTAILTCHRLLKQYVQDKSKYDDELKEKCEQVLNDCSYTIYEKMNKIKNIIENWEY